MKIVHLIYSFEIGGAESMLVDILNEQCKFEDITLLIINDRINESLIRKIDSSVAIVRINRISSGKNPIPVIKLNWILLKINPDIIHSHDPNGIKVLAPFFRKCTILTIHDTNIESTCLEKYKKKFAISKSVQEDVARRYHVESTLILNGIPVSKIISYRKESDQSGLFRIVQVGRLEHLKKGQHLLIEALNKLINKHKITDLHLDIIGQGSSMILLKDLANQLNLNDFVCFLGEKDREYIYENLHTYDLLVQPSIYEGFGLTVAEAMAAKVPTLVSDIDGPMEIIGNGEYGFYFKSGDIENLTGEIMKIKTDWEDAKKLSDKAYDHTIEKFSIEQTAKNYLLSYKSLL